MVYAVWGSGLKVVDVIYGILLIAIAAFGVYTRFRLAKYRADAPLCVYILYGAGAALPLFYNAAVFAATGINQLFSVGNIISIAASVGFIFINRAYFTKRKDLFVR